MAFIKETNQLFRKNKFRKHDISNISFKQKSVIVDFYKSGTMTYLKADNTLLRFENFKNTTDQNKATKNIIHKERTGFLKEVIKYLLK